jgi:hypothetical protein
MQARASQYASKHQPSSHKLPLPLLPPQRLTQLVLVLMLEGLGLLVLYAAEAVCVTAPVE